jgi:uncharacterized protein
MRSPVPAATHIPLELPLDGFDTHKMHAGATTRCWLTVPVGLTEAVRLPTLVTRGTSPGPTVLLVAGIHGDEFEGVAALPELTQRLSPTTMCGTVIAICVCNPFAFTAQSRTSPNHLDGANLARQFPGDPTGTPTQRLAAALFALATNLLGPNDLLVDLHSAGSAYRYLMLVGFREFDGPARQASEAAARHFGGQQARLWAIWPQRGMFNAETTLAGIPTVACEAPGQGRCRTEDVTAYVEGLLNLLRHQGVVPGAPPPPSQATAACPTELYAPADGLLITEIEPGDQVVAGQRLAVVIDPFGDDRGEIYAPHSGEVWAVRTFATVYANEYVLWIGPPSTPDPGTTTIRTS